MINKSSCLYYWLKIAGGYRWYYQVILVCCLVSEAADIWCLFALCTVTQTAVKFLYADLVNSDNMSALLCSLPFSRKEIFNTYIGTVFAQCLVMTVAANFRYLDQPVKVCFNLLFALVIYIVCVLLLNFPKLAVVASVGEGILWSFILLAVVIEILQYLIGVNNTYMNGNSMWTILLECITLFLFVIAIVETVRQRKKFLRK